MAVTEGVRRMIFLLLLLDIPSSWAEWWEYTDTDRGPSHWGITNPEWRICRDGKFQSPINIQSSQVKHDPSLDDSLLVVSGSQSVWGWLQNTGQELQFMIDREQTAIVSLEGGPLPYTYRLSHVKLRYGTETMRGSEHSIDGIHFDAELQLFFYNDYLYTSYESALGAAYGIAALAIFVQESENDTNEEFQSLFHGLNKVAYRDQQKKVENVNVRRLLPNTVHYVTYEGSLTAPPCKEGVTWIIYNRPINTEPWHIRNLRNYITRSPEPDPEDPAPPAALPMMGNTRPIQATSRKHLWTNLRSRESGDMACRPQFSQQPLSYSMNTVYRTRLKLDSTEGASSNLFTP